MAHVPDGKIKTNMFLIWAGPDGEDIYDNFKLPPNHQYDVDYVLDKFEECCQPLCNFRAARWKFRSVSQHASETIDMFYHRILKICDQCEFSNPEENLIDAIIYGTNNNKAQEKLLQMPVTLTLQQTLTVCRHFESLKLHIEQIRPTKSVDYLRKRQQKSKKKSGQADQGQPKGKQSFQPKANPNLN